MNGNGMLFTSFVKREFLDLVVRIYVYQAWLHTRVFKAPENYTTVESGRGFDDLREIQSKIVSMLPAKWQRLVDFVCKRESVEITSESVIVRITRNLHVSAVNNCR